MWVHVSLFHPQIAGKTHYGKARFHTKNIYIALRLPLLMHWMPISVNIKFKRIEMTSGVDSKVLKLRGPELMVWTWVCFSKRLSDGCHLSYQKFCWCCHVLKILMGKIASKICYETLNVKIHMHVYLKLKISTQIFVSQLSCMLVDF